MHGSPGEGTGPTQAGRKKYEKEPKTQHRTTNSRHPMLKAKTEKSRHLTLTLSPIEAEREFTKGAENGRNIQHPTPKHPTNALRIRSPRKIKNQSGDLWLRHAIHRQLGPDRRRRVRPLVRSVFKHAFDGLYRMQRREEDFGHDINRLHLRLRQRASHLVFKHL